MSAQAPIAVIDYGAGNLPNAVRALRSVGAQIEVTSDPDRIARAAIVVLPGVGATRDTMVTLQRTGMDEAIHTAVAHGAPFVGICVGMQVLCTTSEEFGQHDCLDLLPGTVRRLPDSEKVPQIGWNQVYRTPTAAASPLFVGIPDGSDFYFVHSYYCDLTDPAMVLGTTTYGVTFPAVVQHGQIVAVQFHPEKSGRHGLRLLRNIVAWASTATGAAAGTVAAR